MTYLEYEYELYRSRRNRARMERMRKQASRWKLAAVLLAIALTVAVAALLISEPPTEAAAAETTSTIRVTAIPALSDIPPAEEDSPLYHLEAISFYAVPLDHDLQAHIIRTCNEYGVDPALVMAVIQKESAFDAGAIGDGGDSAGLMQVQEKWHRARMERLGVTDLLDSYQNTLVGIDYLAELLDKYSVADALTAYNSGSPGESQYAAVIMSRMEELQ